MFTPFETYLLYSVLFLIIVLLFLVRRQIRLAAKLKLLLTQKKSSEVRTGKISEVLAPLTESFPVDVKKVGTATIFLGQPVDYIHFDPETGITFIEVKSGESELSSTQRRLKKLVLERMVFWKELRIK